jgi:hypothetical protein
MEQKDKGMEHKQDDKQKGGMNQPHQQPGQRDMQDKDKQGRQGQPAQQHGGQQSGQQGGQPGREQRERSDGDTSGRPVQLPHDKERQDKERTERK